MTTSNYAAIQAGITAKEREIASYRARRIEARFEQVPELEQYRDLIYYDWIEGEEHLDWIASAPVGDILSWAAVVRQGIEGDVFPSVTNIDELEPSTGFDGSNA